MFAELLDTYSVLKKWKQNPAATKREIGIWAHWKEDCAENDCPLSQVEVQKMKSLLRRHAPTSYFEIFAEETM